MNLDINEIKDQIQYNIPEGWWIGFGEDLCKELYSILSHLPSGAIKDFKILQVKEKFGGLRIYTNWQTKEITALIKKYENLSRKTCVVCGKPATQQSTDWICPWCDVHAPMNCIPI